MLEKIERKMRELDPYAKKVSRAEYQLATDAGLVVLAWVAAVGLMMLSIVFAAATQNPALVSRGGTIWIALGVLLTVRDIDHALRLSMKMGERDRVQLAVSRVRLLNRKTELWLVLGGTIINGYGDLVFSEAQRFFTWIIFSAL